MSVLYIEPFSGISGDMFLGAVAPLADAEDEIASLPDKLGLDGVSIQFTDAMKSGIRCRKVDITLPEQKESDHRHLSDIERMIREADLGAGAKDAAVAIFRLLGKVEARVHDIPLEKVHFHEVGALDSIIDIVGAAILIDRLDVAKTYCDPVCTGYGFVHTAHGRLPVPAPATELLLQNMPTLRGQTEAELVTPTGAAILNYLAPDFQPGVVSRTASSWGAGSKDFDHPNALRVSLIRENDDMEALWLLQTNVDDMTGELLGADFLTGCIEAGALDAWLTPIIMKKGRPALQIDALCAGEDKETLASFLLEHTTTLGLRILPVQRRSLPRSFRTVETPFGAVRLKIATLPSGKERAVPEYEECAALAREAGVPVREIFVAAMREG